MIRSRGHYGKKFNQSDFSLNSLDFLVRIRQGGGLTYRDILFSRGNALLAKHLNLIGYFRSYFLGLL